MSLDSSACSARLPDVPLRASGNNKNGWTTKIHLVAADARTEIALALSPGNDHDAPCGRQLLLDL